MNKRQKKTVAEFTTILILTSLVLFGMYNLKDIVNRSEAMRAMTEIGQDLAIKDEQIREKYRSEYGVEYPEKWVPLPSSSYVEALETQVKGRARLGKLHYRGPWISLNDPNDTILAYTQCKYNSWFVDNGYVVLRVDRTVEWVDPNSFERELASQQTVEELQMQVR